MGSSPARGTKLTNIVLKLVMIKKTRAKRVEEVGRSDSNPDFLKYHAYLVRNGKLEDKPRPVYGRDMQHALRILSAELRRENFIEEKNQWRTIALTLGIISIITTITILFLL